MLYTHIKQWLGLVNNIGPFIDCHCRKTLISMADLKDAPEKRRPDEVEESKREASNKKQKLEEENNGKHLYNTDGLTMAESEDDEDYDAEDDDGVGQDTKGKEILINEKGKGKLLVDSDSSDDSDSNFSDVEDDLLTEIDLDNILPSRTRNRRAQAALRISRNCDNKDTGA